MATFTGSPVVPAGLSPEELLAPMAAFDTHQNALLKQQADTIANAYAPQRNQLFLDTGAIANQFATAKNPLEIQSLRQQLGLDPNPNRDQIMRLFSGDGTGQTPTAGGGGTGQTAGGDSTTETADDLTRAAAVRDGLIRRGMQPDGATAFAANALHESKANPFTGAGDAGASHGIFQWNGDRLAAFKAANGGLLPEQTSLDKQLDFVVSELHGPESTAMGRIMGAQGVADKAGQVSEAYLRPKDTVPEMQRRSATALRLARAWGGQGAPGATPPAPGGPPGVTLPPAATAVGPAIGAPGGPNITPGMTDQAWLEEMAKRYPTLAGPNDTSQQPNAAAPPAPYQVASNAPVAPPLPPNQLAPGGDRGPLAPAPAPPPTAPTAPTAAPAQTGGLPRMADVPSGMARPEVRQAQQLLQRATQIELLASQTPKDLATQQAAKAAADNLRLRAQTLLQTDSVVQTQEGQFHPMTGKLDDPVKPLPHYVYDPNMGGPGVGGFVDTTGTNKPEFEPAQRDTAVAQQTVMVLGPKIAAADAGTGPPVTPEERARYNVAATTYQQFKEIVDPVTKQVKQVPTRPLPDGLPQPPSAAGSRTLTEGLSPSQQEVERDPAAYKVAESQYERDSKEIPAIGDAGRQSQADQVRIKEMQDVLQRFSTGPGTGGRTEAAAWLQRWLPSALTGWEKQSANLSGSEAAQAFSKLALVGAGTQERGVLGARGGYQAIKLFKEANPNIDLQDATNKSILDMQLISNQANQDYSQAALSHFADNETKFGQTHKYDSLAQFDRAWNAQRNPQVYAAAMGAVSGQPASQWSKGLSDDEYKRALDIVSRASPSATVNAKSGRISMQPQGGQGQGGGTPVSVRTPAEAEGLQPGTRYTTPDGRTFTR
jgi:hypothetical protein